MRGSSAREHSSGFLRRTFSCHWPQGQAASCRRHRRRSCVGKSRINGHVNDASQVLSQQIIRAPPPELSEHTHKHTHTLLTSCASWVALRFTLRMRNICCQLLHLDYDLCAVPSISICMCGWVCVCVCIEQIHCHQHYIHLNLSVSPALVCPAGSNFKKGSTAVRRLTIDGQQIDASSVGSTYPLPGCLPVCAPLHSYRSLWLLTSPVNLPHNQARAWVPSVSVAFSPAALKLVLHFSAIPIFPFPNSLSHFSLF